MISVVVVSSKTQEQLLLCLRSICVSATSLKDAYEIIVLFNHKQKIVFPEVINLARKNNNIKLVESNKQQPLSLLKNQGVSLALGEIVAFTDDDCTVSETWLASILKALKDKEAWCYGEVRAGVKLPFWAKGKAGWLVGINNKGAFAVGSNMAFSKSIITKYKFQPNIGPGTNCPLGEDYQLAIILDKAGIERILLEDSYVFHHIQDSKKTFSYAISRCRDEAKMQHMLFGKKTIFKRIFVLIFFPIAVIMGLNLNPFFRAMVSFYFILLWRSFANVRA